MRKETGKTINVGFIGTGRISSVHLEYLMTREDVTIAALCDTDAGHLRKHLAVCGGSAFADFNEMLDNARLDAVWLCTPPDVRRGPLLACADRGIPVFCEKPVGVDIEKSAKTAAELAARKARVQIGYVFRSMPAVEFLRRAMADDSIHLVQSLYASNTGITMGLEPWMYDKSKSGGFLVDQATHNLDLLRSLFGEAGNIQGMSANPVRRKGGGYTIEETIGLVFLFENRLLATHMHTCVADDWRNEIVMSGEKRVYRLESNKGLLLVEGACDKPPEPKNGELAVEPDGMGFTFRQSPGSIYAHENARFLGQVISGDWSGNPSDFEDGLKTLRLTLECDRAASGGYVG